MHASRAISRLHPVEQDRPAAGSAGWRHRAAQLFVIAMLAFVIVPRSIPAPATLLKSQLTSLLMPHATWLGLWGEWAMFAPNPRNDNADLEAVFEDASGRRVASWEFSRISSQSAMERWWFGRDRKWQECLHRAGSEVAWTDLLRFYARLCHAKPGTIVKGKLVRHWCILPAPGAGDHQPVRDLPRDHTAVLFSHCFRQGELE